MSFFSTKLHCHWTSHNLAQYICYYPSSLKTSLQKMKWKMNKNNNKTVNHPPAAADAAATELPAATWSRNHSGKLLHYYIRQIKHKKHYLKWSDPISAQLCMTIRCNLRRVRTSVHLNHDFQPKTNPSLNKNQYLKNPAFQYPQKSCNPLSILPQFKKTKQEKASILNTQDNVGQAVAN